MTIVLEMCEQLAEQLRKYGARPHQYSVFSNVCPWCFKGVCVCLLLQDLLQSGTREEPGTLTQGAPVFPGSSRLGIEPNSRG